MYSIESNAARRNILVDTVHMDLQQLDLRSYQYTELFTQFPMLVLTFIPLQPSPL